MMGFENLAILVLVFLITSAVGVVTGSNSLITVPLMFQFGIPEKTAVATNMFGLTFMAIGASIPFVRQQKVEVRGLLPQIVLTVIGSAIGAALVGMITDRSIKVIVSVAMVVIVIFTILRPGAADPEKRIPAKPALGLVLTFILAIYGGLYSGGYVTVLTAAFVAFLGMTYSEAIGATKIVNVFSSSVATMVFMRQGLVEYRLGIILAITMFVGAYAGAHYAVKMNDVWLRRIFLATVALLAIKTLYDLF